MFFDLSIIIVNYKSASLILNCIDSIKRETQAINYEIIVVDNFSEDAGKKVILDRFPDVIWLQMGYNSGFARANNAGIKQAKGQVVLLLNPDTIILKNAIEKSYLKFVTSAYVACAVQLLNPDFTPQITGNYFLKGGLNHLLTLPYLGPFLRQIAFAIKVQKTNIKQAGSEEEVDWINGAYLMVKKSAIKKAGLMDEDFFLYAEEIEWCYRLQKVGHLCVYGDLQILHLQGETINKETNTTDKGYSNLFDKKGLQLIVSILLRIRKQYGSIWFLFHLFVFSVEIPIFVFCSFFDHLFHKRNPFGDVKRIKGFTLNVGKVWLLAPKIIMGRTHFYKML